MIKWFKKTSAKSTDTSRAEINQLEITTPNEGNKMTLIERFKSGLFKTHKKLGLGIERLFLGKKHIDQAVLDELEVLLLSADIGIQTTNDILEKLTAELKRNQLNDGAAIYSALKEILEDILQKVAQPLTIPAINRPFVILMIGINGAGKTTTIGKLAQKFKNEGKSVLLAAGDTFRAAAIEQLLAWGEKNEIAVIAQQSGADSASVIYDSLQAAAARKIDVVLADTAGRLHTQTNLLEELKKIKRVMQKLDSTAPHEIMLVLDAGIGQNALNQANEFKQAVDVTGITMTKLDGSAKGGILFAIAKELAIPIRYIGMGENINDLQPFNAHQYVRALFHDDTI